MPPGLLISAPASGAGKTTLTLGLLAAMRADGVALRAFKSGPDYIDPALHHAACGAASINLDSWAMDRATIERLVAQAQDAEFILAEGSMGLFDGVAAPGALGTGASADVAALMGWPVVLALDVSGQAQSAAATALGFRHFRPDVELAGVVLNKVASPRHEALARAGMEAAGLHVFGALPRQSSVAMPTRHLGLVQAEEQANLVATLEETARFVRAHVDIAALKAAARGRDLAAASPMRLRPPGQRIALARDAAFSFVYPHLLAGWREAGAQIIPFSPLADEAPDPDADVCWLPGGYPELHAGKLAAATRFRSGLKAFARTRPVHGECGGYMALGAALIDADGVSHEMAGALGLVTSFAKRKMHLGYRQARLLAPTPGHDVGAVLRGHEFHYASIIEQPDAPLADVRDATGARVAETGSRRGSVSGSFFHLIAEAM